VTLKLYDSRSQSLRDFVPLEKGKVGIYLCGPTVQSLPHLGHLRSALVYDQLVRWLEATGNQVTLIRNVTDIDDKVLQNAAAENRSWWGLAYECEQAFASAYKQLNIANPSYEPRATANIIDMIGLIQQLISKGHAYQVDNSADVFFSATSWPNYGELTNQTKDDLISDTEADSRGKKDPRDFALWKAHKDNEPIDASWESPFGRGRPGWHIECSAMSVKYLNVAGAKMSKSAGNSILVKDVLNESNALAVRYYLGSAQYRSVLDYNQGVIEEAAAAIERIAAFLNRAGRKLSKETLAKSSSKVSTSLPKKFIEAMNDDLNMPAALAVLHESVRAGNTALDSDKFEEATEAYFAVLGIVNVLNINPLDSAWQSQGSADEALKSLDILVQSLIEQRNVARENKDFETSDRIRDQLKIAGITLEDEAGSTNWSLGA
jgi:cysteinyl-tRNA synthetase